MITVKASNGFEPSRIKALTEKILDTYDGSTDSWDLSETPDITPIKLGNRSALLAIDGVCVKFFYDKSLKSRIRDFFGLSKAQRTYEIGTKVTELGVPIPKLYGMSKKRFSYGMVLSKFEEDCLPVHLFTRGDCDSTLWSRLGLFIRTMHDKGITHKDLSPKNILTVSSSDSIDFLLLDYEDCKIHTIMTDILRLGDLHHIYERLLKIASTEQRLLLVKGYISDCEGFSDYHEQLLRMIKENPSKYTKFIK